MSIARFENININNLTFTKSDFGEGATVQALWFATRARVSSVANSLKIAEKYRLYQDMTNFTLNYTRNMKLIVANQYAYSITYRGQDWRIDSARESDDRMTVMFLCYRSDPITAV
jgi:hypothetical protein